VGLRVVLSGRTAAGKSTHGRLLARDLEMPYVSATQILARLVAERTGSRLEQRWQPSLDRARGADSTIDDDLDAEMTGLFSGSSEGVFDACLLPWVAPDVPAVRVWLESDFPSRLRKCVVSHWDVQISWGDAQERVVGKDAFTSTRLAQSCGGVYEPDADRFEVIVSNSDLIPEATPEAARAGIASLQPVLLGAVKFAAGMTLEQPKSEWILRLGRQRQ
jgi:cytidylate kinase